MLTVNEEASSYYVIWLENPLNMENDKNELASEFSDYYVDSQTYSSKMMIDYYRNVRKVINVLFIGLNGMIFFFLILLSLKERKHYRYDDYYFALLLGCSKKQLVLLKCAEKAPMFIILVLLCLIPFYHLSLKVGVHTVFVVVVSSSHLFIKQQRLRYLRENEEYA